MGRAGSRFAGAVVAGRSRMLLERSRDPVSKRRQLNPKKKLATRSNQPLEALENRVLLAGSLAAKVFAAPLEVWGPTYTFKVAYSSSSRLRPSSIDSKDILVTGPN